MPSISIRKPAVPANVTLLFKTGSLPPYYSYDCNLFNRFPKGTAACTCPGACTGASSHGESCVTIGAHTHTASFSGHSHPGSWTSGADSTGPCPSEMKMPGGNQVSPKGHTHSVSANASSPGTATFASTPGGTHSHTSTDNEPPYETIKYIKKVNQGTSIRKQLPFNTYWLFSKPIACIPSKFVASSNNGKYHKGAASGCSSIGCTGGSLTHTHGCSGGGSHTHSISAPHSHSTTGAANPAGSGQHCAGNRVYRLHTHSGGTGGVSGSITSPGDACHNHGSTNHEPPYITTALITQTTLHFRQQHVPKNVVGIWEGALNCIPLNYAHADGTNDTVDMRGKHPKQVCGAACPGSTGGSATHQHSPDSGHTHGSTSGPHSHPKGSLSASNIPGGGPGQWSPGGPIGAYPYHTHGTAPGSTPNANLSIPVSSAYTCTHTHDAQTNDPLSYTVAFIQKII